MTYLAFLESLLEGAGRLATSFPSRMSTEVKDADPNQVVTQADRAIGSHIVSRIRAEHPDDNVIDEELGVVRGTSAVTWIIDPVDGTANFAAGSPLFGVMVGVLEHGEAVAGGVALPAFSETYVAEAGQGAYLDGTRLRAEPDGGLAQQLVAYGMDIHPAEVALDCQLLSSVATRCRGIRMSNSVFDCMMVAKGVYGAFMHRHNRIWDCVAAQVVVQEAGGTFSGMDGCAIDYRDPLTRLEEDFSILACGPGLQEPIAAITRDHCPAEPGT